MAAAWVAVQAQVAKEAFVNLNAARKLDAVKKWKARILGETGSAKAMYQWLRMGQEGGKPSCIRRPDGTMTANEMEIDQLTREAWAHIYSRWPEGEEPDGTAHRNRFPPPECTKEVPYLPLG